MRETRRWGTSRSCSKLIRISRRLVRVASVIKAVTDVVASGGFSTTVRGIRRARVATLVREHALLPSPVGLTILA